MKQKSQRSAASWFLLACSACLFLHPGPAAPSELGPPISTINQGNVPQVCPQASLAAGIFPVEVPSAQVTHVLVDKTVFTVMFSPLTGCAYKAFTHQA